MTLHLPDLVHYIFLALTWLVAVVFLLSGLQDFRYDLYNYWLRLYRRFGFRGRERLTRERLLMRDQQWIAVMVPAWNEGEIIAEMVKNILDRVEYNNYKVFVGTYPNDEATQNAVDRIARDRPEVIKVVTARPGPTTKADCLNNVLEAIEAYEETHGINFDIISMHDAEDVVHPLEFLVFNYLIPRVDVVQMPILPLPTDLRKWVHWIYADEFCENHMKDVPAREVMTGFVPYAGVGTGFSRRVIHFLKEEGEGKVFNEASLTEDYSMSKKILDSGYRSIFVNVLLADDRSPWWVPLSRRPGFVANWAYFPMDYRRSVRQKSRWILGISIQEWVQTGWRGSLGVRENLVKDRKVFVALSATLLGYFVLPYVIAAEMCRRGWLPWNLRPVVEAGTPLFAILSVVLVLSLYRLIQRTAVVGIVYGFWPAVFAGPRMMLANIVNGHASFIALKTFVNARRGKKEAQWAKTDHVEGVGALPVEMERSARPTAAAYRPGIQEIERRLRSMDPREMVAALDLVYPDMEPEARERIVPSLVRLGRRPEVAVRARLAARLGDLQWGEMRFVLSDLLVDQEFPVRMNAVESALAWPDWHPFLAAILSQEDGYALDVLVKKVEQDPERAEQFSRYVGDPRFRAAFSRLARLSPVLRAWMRRSRSAA